VGYTSERQASAAGTVLLTLAAGQFLMTLDSTVMNVSIATVAKDVGTTVTGIQTAITQAGLFFAVPLFLSVALGLSAIETGVRILPLSITLLLAAAGTPKVDGAVLCLPNPNRAARFGVVGQ
jgi:MFS family permease